MNSALTGSLPQAREGSQRRFPVRAVPVAADTPSISRGKLLSRHIPHLQTATLDGAAVSSRVKPLQNANGADD